MEVSNRVFKALTLCPEHFSRVSHQAVRARSGVGRLTYRFVVFFEIRGNLTDEEGFLSEFVPSPRILIFLRKWGKALAITAVCKIGLLRVTEVLSVYVVSSERGAPKGPLELIRVEEYGLRADALRREQFLKSPKGWVETKALKEVFLRLSERGAAR